MFRIYPNTFQNKQVQDTVYYINKAEDNFLSPCGKTPLVSTLTGTARVLVATVSLVCTVAARAISFLLNQYGPEKDREYYSSLENDLSQLVSYLACTVLRGLIEAVPVLGNLYLVYHDRTEWDLWDINQLLRPPAPFMPFNQMHEGQGLHEMFV